MKIRSKKILLAWLLLFTLLSVQLNQHSPLHDHSGDIVDCVLCQFDFNDNSTVSHNSRFDFARDTSVFVSLVNQLPASQLYTPYQGRSPPVLLS